MFKLPDYNGRDPKYVKSSLKFFDYHARNALKGEEQKSVLEAIQTEAVEWGINLEKNIEEDS